MNWLDLEKLNRMQLRTTLSEWLDQIVKTVENHTERQKQNYVPLVVIEEILRNKNALQQNL